MEGRLDLEAQGGGSHGHSSVLQGRLGVLTPPSVTAAGKWSCAADAHIAFPTKPQPARCSPRDASSCRLESVERKSHEERRKSLPMPEHLFLLFIMVMDGVSVLWLSTRSLVCSVGGGKQGR